MKLPKTTPPVLTVNGDANPVGKSFMEMNFASGLLKSNASVAGGSYQADPIATGGVKQEAPEDTPGGQGTGGFGLVGEELAPPGYLTLWSGPWVFRWQGE